MEGLNLPGMIYTVRTVAQEKLQSFVSVAAVSAADCKVLLLLLFSQPQKPVVLWSANSHLPPYGPTFTSYNLWTLLLPTCLGQCWFLDPYCKQHFLDLKACMTETCLRVLQLCSLPCVW